VAGIVHVGKTTARPAANVATLGMGAPVLSTVEDGASLGLREHLETGATSLRCGPDAGTSS